MAHYEPHQLYEWENHQHEPKFKDAMILADYFNTSYQVLVESNIKNINNNLMMLIFDYNNFKGTKHIHVEYNVLFLCFYSSVFVL